MWKEYTGITVYGVSDCAEWKGADLWQGYSDDPVKERMKQMTLVSFQNYLFKGSVRENLLMGDPSATEEKLLVVLKKS